MNYSWSESYPDLNKICKLYQLVELANPKRFKYKPLGSYIQEGPQCGIVALALCTGRATKETVKEIFNEAKAQNFTYNGEMFDASDLSRLAAKFLECEPQVYEGPLDSPFIREFLFAGGCLLAPYDSDCNHAPCFRNGKAAHWAAVSGIVETGDAFVLAKQGKSRNLQVWKLDHFSRSNGQLWEFSPIRDSSDVKYKLPPGGISYGLCSKSVLLHGLS